MAHIALAAAAAVLASTVLANAQTAPQSEGRRLAELTFDSVDLDGRGYIDLGQMDEQRDLIFFSMDADESDTLSEEEFTSWGYGFQNIAEAEGKQLAYNTALRVVFSFWDRDGNGEITPTEHRKAVYADFERADLNNNAVLEKDEFLRGFSVLVAIRAALKPQN